MLEVKAHQLLVAHDENKRWRAEALQYVEKIRMEQALALSIPPNIPNVNKNLHLLNFLSRQQQRLNSQCKRKQNIINSSDSSVKRKKSKCTQKILKSIPNSQKPPWLLCKQQHNVLQNSELFDIVKSVTNAAVKTRESILDLTAVVQQEAQIYFKNLVNKIERWLDAYPLQQRQSLARSGQQRKLKNLITESIRQDRDANRKEATRRFNDFLMTQSASDQNVRAAYVREFFRVVYGRYSDEQQQNLPIDLWQREDGSFRDYVFRPQPVSTETKENAICEFYSRLDEMNRFRDNLARIRFEPEIGQIYFRETKQPEPPILERDPHLWNNPSVKDMIIKTRAKCVETIVCKELLPGLLQLGGNGYHIFLLTRLMREPWVLHEGIRVSLDYFLERRREDDMRVLREALVKSALSPINRLFVFSKHCFENLDVFARGHSYSNESINVEARIHLLCEYFGYLFLHSSKNKAALERAHEWVKPAFSIWCLYPGLYLDLMHNLKRISRGQMDYTETLINSTARLILQSPSNSSSKIEMDIALRINFAVGLVLTAPSLKEFVFSSHRQSLYFGRWITMEFQPDVPESIKNLYNNDDDDNDGDQGVFYSENFYFDPDSLQDEENRKEEFFKKEQLTRALREAIEDQREDLFARLLGKKHDIFMEDKNTFEIPEWQREAMSRFYARLVGGQSPSTNSISKEGLEKLDKFSNNVRNLIQEKYAPDWIPSVHRTMKDSLNNISWHEADDMDTLKARIINESAASLYNNMLIGNTDTKFSTLLGYDDYRPSFHGPARPDLFYRLSAYRPKKDAVVLNNHPQLIDLHLKEEDQTDVLTLPQEHQRVFPAFPTLSRDTNISGSRYRNESLALEQEILLTKEKQQVEAQKARALRNKLIQTSARDSLGNYEMKMRQLMPPQPVPMKEEISAAAAAAAAAVFSNEGISDQPRGAFPENIPNTEQYVRQLIEEGDIQDFYRRVPSQAQPSQLPRRRSRSSDNNSFNMNTKSSKSSNNSNNNSFTIRRSRSPSRRPSPFSGIGDEQKGSNSFKTRRSRSPSRRLSPFSGTGHVLTNNARRSVRPETDSNFSHNIKPDMLLHQSRGGNMPDAWATNPLALLINMVNQPKNDDSIARRPSSSRTRARSLSPSTFLSTPPSSPLTSQNVQAADVAPSGTLRQTIMQGNITDIEALIALARNDPNDIFDNNNLKAHAIAFLNEPAEEYFGGDVRLFSVSFNVNSPYIPMTLRLSEMVKYLAGFRTREEGKILAAESWLKIVAKIKAQDQRTLAAIDNWNINANEFMQFSKYRNIVADDSDRMDHHSTFLLACIFGLPVDIRFSGNSEQNNWIGGSKFNMTTRINMEALHDTFFRYISPWNAASNEQPLPIFINNISHFAALGLKVFRSVQREVDFATAEAEIGALYLLSVMVDVMRNGDLSVLKRIFVNYSLDEFSLPSRPTMITWRIPPEDIRVVIDLNIDQSQYFVGRVDGDGNCMWASLSVWFYGSSIYWPIIKFYTYRFLIEYWDSTLRALDNCPIFDELLQGLPFFAFTDTEMLKIISTMFQRPVLLAFSKNPTMVGKKLITFPDRLYMPNFSVIENPGHIPQNSVYLVMYSHCTSDPPSHFEPVISINNHIFYEPPSTSFR